MPQQLVKAIRPPFGDHWAEIAPRPDGVIWRRPVPSAFTTKSAVANSRPFDTFRAANVTRDPSGDQSAPTSSKKGRSITHRFGGLNWSPALPSGFTENRVPWLPLESNRANRMREPSGE